MSIDNDPADVATDLRTLTTDDRVKLGFEDRSLTAVVVSGSHYQPAGFDEEQFSAGELWADFEVNEEERARLELPDERIQVVAMEYRIGMWRRPTATVRRFLYGDDDSNHVVGEEWDDLGRIKYIERENGR